MFDVISGYFSSAKAIMIGLGAIFLGGYIAKQKYNAYQAETKLQNIETKIAKTNVIVAKKKATAKAQAVKVETTTEVEILRELKKEAKVVQKEMETIEKDIVVHTQKSEEKVTRKRHSKVKFSV